MHRSTLILLMVVAVGALLRFWGLDSSSLWTDELDSWRHSNQLSLSAVLDSVGKDAHPPLYFVLLHSVIVNFGDSEWMLRALSAIAGVAAVPAIYFLGKQLYTAREGLIGAAIMAVSWAPIYYSQEARAYSLLLFFSIVLFYHWLVLMKKFEANEPVPLANFIGYAITATVLCYLHYFGLQLVVLQGLGFVALFIFRPAILARSAAVYGVVFLAYLPWLPVMRGQLDSHKSHWVEEVTLWQSSEEFVSFSFHVNEWILFVLILPAYIYAAMRGVHWLRQRKQGGSARAAVFSSGGLLLLWSVLPFLAAYVQSVLHTPVLINRYMICLLPAVYLLLARALAVMPERMGQVWTGLLCLALLLSLVLDDHYYSQPQKDQHREATAHIVELQGRYPDLPVVAFTWHKEFFDYYLQRLGSAERVALLAGRARDVPGLDALLQARNAAGFWYLAGQRVPEQGFLEQLDNRFLLQDEVELQGASARLYLLKE